MFKKSWNGPSLEDVQAQSTPTAADALESEPRQISSIGFLIIAFVLTRALVAGLVVVRSSEVAGHTQADMDRDVTKWKSANIAYQQSADCGSLKGQACRDHWRDEVVPNLKTAEAAWGQMKSQMQFEFAHRSVPSSCQVAYYDFQAATNSYYGLENEFVSAVANNNLSHLDDMIAREKTASDEVQRLGQIDARECKNY